MYPVSEVSPNALLAGQVQTRQHVIASVIALQRVIAAQAGAESGDASARNGNDERQKALRTAERAKLRPTQASSFEAPAMLADRSAEARSIVEAQEASATERKIVAAFQARYGLNDLLSVIRDPENATVPEPPAE